MENIFEQLFLKIKDLPTKSNKRDAFNIFKVLGIESKEVLACRLLGELMNPHGTHGLGEKPLQLFLQRIDAPDFTPENLKNATIVLEEMIDNDRRVDIVIYIKDFVIPIEVKIWADDQNKQLYDYYQYFKKPEYSKHNFRIYYLTPNGRNPSLFSTNNELQKGCDYKCISFDKDISEWLEDISKKLNCGAATANKERVDIVLEQFKEIISDMCTQEINLQMIKKAINFSEGQFESNDSMKALLCILEANQGNKLWKAIRKEYLRKNLIIKSNDYEITEIPEEDYETIEIPEGKKGYCIFSIKKSEKTIAWICIETNLYIVAKSLKSDNLNGWKGNESYYWRYLNPNGKADAFNLKEPNPAILNDDASIDIESLLEQIEE